ncbi:hypothetical protein [Curtobacterium flaccumfaciens]|uniref:hypothetical protein n=1 Tax=Curtobacterium flaccumfaciens TaxID=2035 RepID=UPI002207D5DF|nr:hypothetical protein [Curtobacterium flaccumfaciens]UWD79253.1 hypothetical protein NY058_00305 [Curtobacterium flaccumfaciens]
MTSVDTRHQPRRQRAALFIAAARRVHGRRYGYEKVVDAYVTSKDTVPIFCRVHERFFLQPPHDHLKPQGCPDCGGRRGADPAARANAFVDKARRRHGGRYDYDVESFVDAHRNVRVFCRETGHGWFDQRATNHLRGQGCPRCALEERQRTGSAD